MCGGFRWPKLWRCSATPTTASCSNAWGTNLVRRSRTKFEALPVAHLRRADAPTLLGLAGAVRGPAATLLQTPGACIVVEHPERRLGVVAPEELPRPLDQQSSRTDRPAPGLDVDRVQLTEPGPFAARADGGKPDNGTVVPRHDGR